MSTTKDDVYIMIILLQLILYILGKSKLDLYLILIKKKHRCKKFNMRVFIA